MRADVKAPAKKRWGARWVSALVAETGWTEGKLRTFLFRGQRRDDLGVLQAAVGLRSTRGEALREPTPPYLLQEVREVRSFTSLVEALRKIDREDGPAYRAAWRVVMASAEALRALAGWTDADWEATITMDHWKTLTKQPEEHTIRRALDAGVKGGTDR